MVRSGLLPQTFDPGSMHAIGMKTARALFVKMTTTDSKSIQTLDLDKSATFVSRVSVVVHPFAVLFRFAMNPSDFRELSLPSFVS
jgi:hypothetical protein